MEATQVIKASERLDGIGEYYFSTKLREIDAMNQAGKAVINLGIGSPDLPPHPEVIRTLQEESARPGNHAYQSYKGSPVLRQAMAGWYQRVYAAALDPVSEILPLIGSKEGIMHICMAFLNTGDRVLIPDPGYPTYSSAVRLAGGIPVSYAVTSADADEPDFAAIEGAGLSGVKLMFVNYPQMPTGQQGNRELFEKIIAFAQKHALLVIHDNPYSFILNDEPLSMLSIEGAKEYVLELNSLSKSHNMAGWRIGMIGGNAVNIDTVLRFKSNMDSGMFLPLQLAAAKALELGEEWHRDLNRVYAQRRAKAWQLLDLLGCSYKPGQAGLFIWAKCPDGYADGYACSDDVLARANVFITPGGIFGERGKKFVRVSLCASEEKIDQAIARIENAFKNK